MQDGSVECNGYLAAQKQNNTTTTLSLTDNEVKLTAWSGLLRAVLRLTGPALLGCPGPPAPA
jgi:hypothetical protein